MASLPARLAATFSCRGATLLGAGPAIEIGTLTLRSFDTLEEVTESLSTGLLTRLVVWAENFYAFEDRVRHRNDRRPRKLQIYVIQREDRTAGLIVADSDFEVLSCQWEPSARDILRVRDVRRRFKRLAETSSLFSSIAHST